MFTKAYSTAVQGMVYSEQLCESGLIFESDRKGKRRPVSIIYWLGSSRATK